MPAFTYTLTTGPSLLRSDGAIVPADPANVDYQAYMAWVVAGNSPAPVPVPPNPATIDAAAFFARFTTSEQAAVQAACDANSQLGVVLTLGLAQGFVTLTSPLLAQWMGGLVSAGALTSARVTAITTP